MTTTLQNIETIIGRFYSQVCSTAVAVGTAAYLMLSPVSAVAQEAESNPDNCHYQQICDTETPVTSGSFSLTRTPGTPDPKSVVVKPAAKAPPQGPSLATRVRALEDANKDYRTQLQGVWTALGNLRPATPGAPEASTLTAPHPVPDQALLDKIDGLVSRLEGYEALRQQTEAFLKDPALAYMLPIFRRGLQELQSSKDAMLSACVTADRAPTTERSADKEAVARVQSLEFACRDATAAYLARNRELSQRIYDNIFGRGRGDTRRVWFELGTQYRHDGAHDGAVVGAVTYRGDHLTVGFGAGAGYGEKNSTESHSTIHRDPVDSGRYQEVASELRSELTALRYRGHGQLRLSTRDFPLGRSRRLAQLALAGGLVTDLIVSDQAVTSTRTRTTQLYREGEQVASHQVTDSDTERSTHYSLVPGMALELWRDANRDGYALGVRGTLGMNMTDEQLDATLMLLGRF